MADKTARFFLLIGPSGVGKTTLLKQTIKEFTNIAFVPSYTTRPPRNEEVNTQDYFFISTNKFEQLLKTNKLLEWDKPHGTYYYGISNTAVSDFLKRGISLIKEIGINGYKQLKNSIAKNYLISIFITPDKLESLKYRLEARELNSNELLKRLETANQEIKWAKICNYTIVSFENDIDKTYLQLRTIVNKYI